MRIDHSNGQIYKGIEPKSHKGIRRIALCLQSECSLLSTSEMIARKACNPVMSVDTDSILFVIKSIDSIDKIMVNKMSKFPIAQLL